MKVLPFIRLAGLSVGIPLGYHLGGEVPAF